MCSFKLEVLHADCSCTSFSDQTQAFLDCFFLHCCPENGPNRERVRSSSPTWPMGKCPGLAIRSGMEIELYYFSLGLQAGHLGTLRHWAQLYTSQGCSERPMRCWVWKRLSGSRVDISQGLSKCLPNLNLLYKSLRRLFLVLIADLRQIIISFLGLRVVVHTQHYSHMVRCPISTELKSPNSFHLYGTDTSVTNNLSVLYDSQGCGPGSWRPSGSSYDSGIPFEYQEHDILVS